MRTNKKTRNVVKKIETKSPNSNLIKGSILATAIVASISLSFPSIASITPTSVDNVDKAELANLSANGRVEGASATSLITQVQATKDEATNCADPANVDGLAHTQVKTIEDMKRMILTPINTDKIFSTASKGGCFNALKDFPNLSASIPSLTSIADSLKKTLVRYATRKVCTAVNDALTEVIEPINEVMDKISENGQIDLTGEFNNRMTDELYKIDPELGRVSQPVDTEYSWELSKEIDKIAGSLETNEFGYIDTPVETAPSTNTTTPPPAATPSGSYVTNFDRVDNSRNESNADGSLTQSAKDFLSSIFGGKS